MRDLNKVLKLETLSMNVKRMSPYRQLHRVDDCAFFLFKNDMVLKFCSELALVYVEQLPRRSMFMRCYYGNDNVLE